MPKQIDVSAAMQPLRDALKPRGQLPLTVLRLSPGCAVNADVPQRAIDEIIRWATMGKGLGEPESACMQLAKIVLMDSAHMYDPAGAERSPGSLLRPATKAPARDDNGKALVPDLSRIPPSFS